MKFAAIALVVLAAIPRSVYADEAYTYDTFYGARPGAVFRDPVKHDSNVVYSIPGQPGIFTALQAKLEKKALNIELWENRIVINSKTYRFSRATAFPEEHTSYIYPPAAEVFIAASTKTHPPLLCVEGHGSGSGEADRYQQIYLLVDPLARQSTFLLLPSLLSSCRAVLVSHDGKLAFPKNSYLFDDARRSRVGLLMSYYTFENRRFVPTSNKIRVRFTEPEIPFQFSVQDKD